MKTKKIAAVLSTVTLATVGISAFTVFADGGEYDSNGQITFTPNTSITPPVDPTNPSNPATPVDPTIPGGTPAPGTAGPLSIDFASGFQFGEQMITTQNMTYNAQAQNYTDVNGDSQTGPNYVQVTDNRGTEAGWTLTVQQNEQFTSTSGEELTGAQFTLMNGNVATASSSPSPLGTATITLDATGGAQSLAMSATEEQGAGTYLLRWGTNGATGGTSVQLAVPGATTKLAEQYATTLTWTLTDVPGE